MEKYCVYKQCFFLRERPLAFSNNRFERLAPLHLPSFLLPPSSSFRNDLARTNLIYTEFPARAPAFHAWMPISDIADARLNLWHRWTIMALDQPFESVSIKTSITLELSLPIYVRPGQYRMYRVVKDLWWLTVAYQRLKPVILRPVIVLTSGLATSGTISQRGEWKCNFLLGESFSFRINFLRF